jgi:hypothetical protein
MRTKRWFTSMALLGACALPYASLADELPALRKGMWEFNRSVEDSAAPGKPVNTSNKKCGDPAADMKRMNDALGRQGCKFSPVVKAGNTYSFDADCRMQGIATHSQSVMSVENDSAYSVDVSSNTAGRSTKEKLVAKRVGDC